MEIDDPSQVASHIPPFSLFPSARSINPFSPLDPNFNRSIFDSGMGFPSRAPFVSHPREVREIPVEVKDGNAQSDHSGLAPKIEDVTETSHEHGPEIRGTVIIDDEDDEDIPAAPTAPAAGRRGQNVSLLGDNSHGTHPRRSAPVVNGLPDYGNDIEEEMIRAAIEVSKWDAEIGYQTDPMPQQRQSYVEDSDLAHAVSLSLKTAEQEKALRDLGVKIGPSEPGASTMSEVEEVGTLPSSNGRLEVGSSSVQEEPEDVEEQPLVRHRSRHVSCGSIDTAKEIGEVDLSPTSSPQQQHNNNHPEHKESDFPSDEWGGISSEEHDEAVMLEAALFGGIPAGSGYPLPHAPHHFTQNALDRTVGPYPRRIPRPPSPSLSAQRLIREQQDDEYLASLQADREKELKAREEAETRHLEEQAAREASVEEERRKEEESRRKWEEEQETESQLAAKEASLPQEPSSDDENAVTLLVRSDGSRRGRRFVKTDKLQCLFDFIDVGRLVKPGTYRLVRPYPRRTFSDVETGLTLNELGLTSKQEALFLELI